VWDDDLVDEEPPEFGEKPGSEEALAARVLLDAARRSDGLGEAGLAAVEEELARVEGSENPDQDALVFLLQAKRLYLEGSSRLEEALAVCERLLDIGEEEGLGGEAFMLAADAAPSHARILGNLGHREEALDEATFFLALQESHHDPEEYSALALNAALVRIEQLVALDRFGEATESWTAVLERYGNTSRAQYRGVVAAVGQTTAQLLVGRRKYRLALAVAEEVIARYRADSDPRVRAQVAVAMAVKVAALSKRGRFVAGPRAAEDLWSFLGPNPEPEVVKAMRRAPGGERFLRNARKYASN
jgi:tetratricopeptide (TPR) repeat protein